MTHAVQCDFCGQVKPNTTMAMILRSLECDGILKPWKTVHSLGSTEDLCPACYELLKKIAKDRKDGRGVPYLEVIDKP